MSEKIRLDFSKASGFAIIPEDDYPMVVETLKYKVTKNGDPSISVKAEITEGDYSPRFVFGTLVLRNDLLWKVEEFLNAFGESVSLSECDFDKNTLEFTDLDGNVVLGLKDLEGKAFLGTVQIYTYEKEGKTVEGNSIKFFAPL